MSGVDVLATFDMCIECFGAAEECPDDTACIDEIRKARAAFEELIESASAGTPIKFQQSRPEVWLRFGGDETRRLQAALARAKGGAA